MNEEKIEEFEGELGCRLPDSYRQFLLVNEGEFLDDPVQAGSSESGMRVDRFLTIEDIQENSRNNCIGIPNMGLLFIGESITTQYLYICVSDRDFGVIHTGNFSSTNRVCNDFSEVIPNKARNQIESSEAAYDSSA